MFLLIMNKEVCKIGKDLYWWMLYRREGGGGGGGGLANLICWNAEERKTLRW